MEIRVRYSERLLKTATRRFWFRYIGRSGIVMVGLLLLILLSCVLLVGDTSRPVLALGVMLLVAIGLNASVYFVYRHRSLSTFRRMKDPDAVFTFSDSGLTSRTDLGGSDLAWRAVTHVWTFPEVWLIFLSKGVYITIPAQALSEDIRSLIRTKVMAQGGKVV